MTIAAGLCFLAANSKAEFSMGIFDSWRIEPAQYMAPFFIAGLDSVSSEWIKNNAEYFRDRGAIGYILNVGSSSEIDALRLSSGLTMIFEIEHVEELVEEYELLAFPVFVDVQNGEVKQ